MKIIEMIRKVRKRVRSEDSRDGRKVEMDSKMCKKQRCEESKDKKRVEM